MKRARTTPRARLFRAAAVWVLTFGLVRAVVAQPEQCGEFSFERIETAIEETIAWATRTQYADGRFIYRYDADENIDLGFYELVRHAGMTMALYQAATVGFARARPVADAADAYARRFLVPAGGGQALRRDPDDGTYDIGATALYLNGLLYKRALDPTAVADAVLVDLGRFLVANIAPSGAVAASWDATRDEPMVGTSSPFFTGEALWAIARLERVMPGVWREPALRVAHYLATERDDAEGRWPDIPDHWAAYALAEMAHWPGESVLDDTLLGYGRHLAELESLQIRYESQRTGSLFSRLTRGQIAVGAGVGALGEGLMALRLVPAFGEDEALRERSRCAVGVLLKRQTTPEQAETYSDPARVRGTWIREGVTQVDDQQHAMSALVLFRELEATA